MFYILIIVLPIQCPEDIVQCLFDSRHWSPLRDIYKQIYRSRPIPIIIPLNFQFPPIYANDFMLHKSQYTHYDCPTLGDTHVLRMIPLIYWQGNVPLQDGTLPTKQHKSSLCLAFRSQLRTLIIV